MTRPALARAALLVAALGGCGVKAAPRPPLREPPAASAAPAPAPAASPAASAPSCPSCPVREEKVP